MIGAKEVRIKPTDQINVEDPNDLWNWHVAVRDSGGDIKELRRNILAIYQYLLKRYNSSDYRTQHIEKVVNKRYFDSQDLEDVRYIIHAESEGITHNTDDIHGHWLKILKDKYEEK